MACIRSLAILLIVSMCDFYFTNGYKWETVKQGDKLPNNIIKLGYMTYVGRIVHYNLILPARVENSSYAAAFNENTKSHIISKQVEVLTATENCEWKYLENNLWDVPENVVRVGKAWNGEPIYLGAVGDTIYKDAVASILLTSAKFSSPPIKGDKYALVCENNVTWVDSNRTAFPKNAIDIGENYFVARLVGPHSLIPAYISNKENYCSSLLKGIKINSLTCQVLVGTSIPNEYSWQKPGLYERIPENAVVQGRTGENEFIYTARDSFRSFLLLTFSKVLSVNYDFEVLVKNTV